MSGPQRRVSLNLQSISFSSKIMYQPPKLDQGQSQFMVQPICCANILLREIKNVVPVIKNEISNILYN